MIRNIGFRRQLSVVFSVGIFLLALVTTIVVSNVSTQTMRERIINEGVQIAEALAEQSTLALLYGSEENAAEAAELLSTFEDVVGIVVLHKDMTPLYQKGNVTSSKVVSPSTVINNITLTNDTDVWQFMAPVQVYQDEFTDPLNSENQQAETIGFVKIYISKHSLREMATTIFTYNLIVSVGLAAILLVVLILISRRLLNPIHHLADVMSAAQKGEQVKKVDMHGPPDIQEMFKAFNTMMEIIKRREEELKKSRDEAVELALLKGEFAANVSHELRTPMNGVLGMLEMLEDTSLTGKEREYLSVARNSAKSLLSLINDILDFSKNEAGKTVLEMEEFDLYEQIEEIVALLGTQTQKKKIDFAYILESGLPRHLIGDANRLRQLLMNLVSNAIKFTNKGTVSIGVCAAENESKVGSEVTLKFSISDTGIGIPSEKLAHIFEAFSQADGSTTRKFGGTGLGLSICKQLVEMMGGEIGVNSTPGEGSCFWFSLTLKQQDKPEIVEATALSQEALKVLLVESNTTVQQSLKTMLVRSKQSCEVAVSKEAALTILSDAKLQNAPIDLLILDEEIGQSTITELVGLAREITERIVCVVLSFSVRDFNLKENRCLYLAKPVLYNHLMLAVKGALSGTGILDIEEEQDAGKSEETEEEVCFPGVRMLVVDDNPVNQLVALGLLKPLAFEADTAINGLDCLEKISQKKYDVILMDCNMPEMDGYKASQKIREQERAGEHMIIIAITANAGPGDKQKCIASGMDDYLVKPFNREDLKAKLARWLPSHQNLPH